MPRGKRFCIPPGSRATGPDPQHRPTLQATTMTLTLVSENRSFGGWHRRYRHTSRSLGCEMVFAVYLPPQAEAGPVPGQGNRAGPSTRPPAMPGALSSAGRATGIGSFWGVAPKATTGLRERVRR